MSGTLKDALKDPVDCFDLETEILSEGGWVKFPQLPKGKAVATLARDGHLEFQIPTEYHEQDYAGDIIRGQALNVDFLVTPRHRMLVFAQHDNLSIRLAEDLCRQDTLPVSSYGIREDAANPTVEIWPGKVVDAGDWSEFMGWYLSEGSSAGVAGGKIQMPGRGYSVMIAQSSSANAENCARIEALLNRLGFTYGSTGRAFRISSKKLWSVLRPLGSKYDKYIPRSVMLRPRRDLERLWEALVMGDGWKQNGLSFYATVSRRLLDSITELLTRLGKPYGNVYTRRPTSRILGTRRINSLVPLHQIGEKRRTVASITDRQKRFLVSREPYSGKVYCVTAPNGTLLVRRNGLPIFAGN